MPDEPYVTEDMKAALEALRAENADLKKAAAEAKPLDLTSPEHVARVMQRGTDAERAAVKAAFGTSTPSSKLNNLVSMIGANTPQEKATVYQRDAIERMNADDKRAAEAARVDPIQRSFRLIVDDDGVIDPELHRRFSNVLSLAAQAQRGPRERAKFEKAIAIAEADAALTKGKKS